MTTNEKEPAALIEQLRHACSVALGDLLAQGMPPGVSTGRLLAQAILAAEEYLTQAEANKDLTVQYAFRDLKDGEHFICWPLPGDNSGHGGYLGEHRLFKKITSQTANSGSDVESTMPASMRVIKVCLT